MAIFSVVASILMLILLTARWRFNPFLAFLITSVFAALLLGIPTAKIPETLEKGMGGLLGPLVAIVCLGAMFGKLIADSGAAQRISEVLIGIFGVKHITWALMLTGLIVGIPLFYNVGFVLLVPLVFSVAYQTSLPAVYLGIPLLAALSVTHGFLPPHPSPAALVPQFHADMGKTLLYGLMVGVPTMMLAGPIFTGYLRGIKAQPLASFVVEAKARDKLPSAPASFSAALLPVVLLAVATLVNSSPELSSVIILAGFLSSPLVVMLLSLGLAMLILRKSTGSDLGKTMAAMGESVKDIALILLIIAGSGALKQVLIESGVSQQIALGLDQIPLNPLMLGWLIACMIRIALGSATVAGLTTAGIMAPLVLSSAAINPNLMVLAIGAGSLMCSHVNDSGFWMYKEYFNLSLKQTFLSWTLMETLIGSCGLVGVLLLDIWV